jgi:hypothetical protein
VRADHALVTKHERAFRTALRVTMAPDDDRRSGGSTPRQPGNRLRYLAEALALFEERLGHARLERLVMALALCVGMESILVLRDICALSAGAAERVKCWAAAALLEASLREAEPSQERGG